LKEHSLSSGYQILRHLHEEFDVLFSPGTIYHQIYLLERKNLIKGEGDDNGRIYCLTEEGEKKLVSTVMASSQIQELVSNILS
jgi:DNA-binding PadR family transcriptional regulator